jgi:hypothetical protein
VYQWCEFKSRRGKNKNLTTLKSNYNTVWLNFQTYIFIYIYSDPENVNIVCERPCCVNVLSLVEIWTHTIDTLQHHSLSLTSSALDHSTTSTPYVSTCVCLQYTVHVVMIYGMISCLMWKIYLYFIILKLFTNFQNI